MKLLIVEDELRLAESIIQYLHNEGFVCEYSNDLKSAKDKVAIYDYDVILLDLTLPDGNGLELLEEIKKNKSDQGVLIFSARNSLDDKVEGLDLGADDYLTKPFHLAELKSRINAIIRRRKFEGKNQINFNEIEIDPDSREVLVQKKIAELTKKEYQLLLYFIANQNRVLTKESIAEHLWGDHIDMADNFDFIYSHIKNLRKKIVDLGGNDYLKTIYGLGYKFGEL